jgi:uncharacterized protein YjiS (DUF1127 family)
MYILASLIRAAIIDLNDCGNGSSGVICAIVRTDLGGLMGDKRQRLDERGCLKLRSMPDRRIGDYPISRTVGLCYLAHI